MLNVFNHSGQVLLVTLSWGPNLNHNAGLPNFQPGANGQLPQNAGELDVTDGINDLTAPYDGLTQNVRLGYNPDGGLTAYFY